MVGWDGRAAIRRAEQVLAGNCLTRKPDLEQKLTWQSLEKRVSLPGARMIASGLVLLPAELL